jgi:hypothetical protein
VGEARNGQVRYELKTPWRNGTTHVIFEPLDFISRLVALVPKPRVNLTRVTGTVACRQSAWWLLLSSVWVMSLICWVGNEA